MSRPDHCQEGGEIIPFSIHMFSVYFYFFHIAGKDSPAEPLLHVAILCRRDVSHVKYEWVSSKETWQSYNSTKHLLELAIDRVLHTSQVNLVGQNTTFPFTYFQRNKSTQNYKVPEKKKC